jgi:hypothetical protein
LPINSGERYAVLLIADRAPSAPASFWISTETRFRKVVRGHAVLQYVAGGTSESPVIAPPHTPPPHPGAWDAELQRLEATYNAMITNGTSISVYGPIRDRVFHAWAEASLAWARRIVASSVTVNFHPVESRSHRTLDIVETQCRMGADRRTLYTPYDATTQSYTNQQSTEGFLK